nr:PREDICTED: uncharacterized protein LOC108225492 isoform X2 [Daucus carota subsp. sativus]
MGTGENDSASVPSMTDKGTESWKPLEKLIPNQVNRETAPVLYEYPFFPPIAAPLANPISFFPSISAPQANGNQSAATSGYPHIFLSHMNSVEDCVPTTISLGKEGKSNESRETLNKRPEGSVKIFQASEFQNTLSSGHRQSSDEYEEKNQAKMQQFLFFEKKQESDAGQKHMPNCVVSKGLDTEKIYTSQEASHGHTLISESSLHVINSETSSVLPESMVVRNTVASIFPVLEGECITDVPMQDEKELEKIRKRRANTLAARRRRIRQKECEKLQALADELSSETSELKETLNNYSKECIRIRRENKALLEEIKEMCRPDEFANIEAQNPDREDNIPSESSSSDKCVDTALQVVDFIHLLIWYHLHLYISHLIYSRDV